MGIVQALMVEQGNLDVWPEGGSIETPPGLLQIVLCTAPASPSDPVTGAPKHVNLKRVKHDFTGW